MLHVPTMHPNLLSVAKFTKDHFVSFTPWGFLVRICEPGKSGFKANVKEISILSSRIQQLSSRRQDPSLPSLPLLFQAISGLDILLFFKILRLLISNKFLDLPARISSTSFCKDCAMGKSTQQPFSIVDRRAHVPFYLVHSDVWMYPISSLSSFRYYVMFTARYSWIYAT